MARVIDAAGESGVNVLFGGLPRVGDALDDTWEWDGTTWTQRSPETRPPARYNH
jgi:hypothetical protein